jgi:hypothetical protein
MQKVADFLNGAQRFDGAATRAFWEIMIGRLRGKPAELLSFDDVRECLRLWQELDRGLQNISINKIVGSVGRFQDFTSSFLPKSTVNRERWSRVFAETAGEMGLPPIEVYQVGDEYFVRDGNHRVSVAHDMGFKTIEAYVTQVTSIDPNYSHE